MACGGELDLVDPPAVNDQVRGAIRKAFEIELGGRDFYVAAAQHTANDALRDTFERLAKMDGEHIATLVRRYHLPPPADADGNLHPGMLQAGGTREPDDPADLLGMALELERRGEEFFRERIAGAAPAAAELYRRAGRRGGRTHRPAHQRTHRPAREPQRAAVTNVFDQAAEVRW